MISVRAQKILVCVGLGALLGGCSLAADVDREAIDDTVSARDGNPRGVLGGYQGGVVWGWAEIIGQDEPVTVRIEVNGTNRATVVAEEYRPDLVIKGLHDDGEAGFKAEMDPPLESGDEIKAFVVGTGKEIFGSPYVVE
jgi:hypothetical protein